MMIMIFSKEIAKFPQISKKWHIVALPKYFSMILNPGPGKLFIFNLNSFAKYYSVFSHRVITPYYLFKMHTLEFADITMFSN